MLLLQGSSVPESGLKGPSEGSLPRPRVPSEGLGFLCGAAAARVLEPSPDTRAMCFYLNLAV